MGIIIIWELFSEDSQDGLYNQQAYPWQRKWKERQEVDGTQWEAWFRQMVLSEPARAVNRKQADRLRWRIW